MPTLNSTTKAARLPKKEPVFEDVRASVFKGVGAKSIQSMDSGELLALQARLGLGDQWGVLVFPENWMPDGTLSQLSVRRIDIQTALGESFSAADEELAIRAVVGAVMLCFAAPVSGPRYSKYLKPSSICTNAKVLVELACLALTMPARADGGFFARLPKPGRNTTETEKRRRIELERLARFSERGLWTDISDEVLAAPPPPSPMGNPVPLSNPPPKRTYLPLNDKFVAEAGYRVAWVVENLGPSLLRCGKGIREIRMSTPLTDGVRETQSWRRTELSKAFLSEFNWKDANGEPISSLPFPMHFSGMGKGGKFVWPPRTMSQARMLLRILQSAHLFIVLISTGGRISETLSLQPGCLTESPDGIPLANGRTYKLSLSVDGKERDWPLPSLAMHAIRQQEELAALAIPVGDDEDNIDDDEDYDAELVEIERIWTREGGSGEKIDGEYNKYLGNIVKIFGLNEEFGDGNLHAHRFRKSTARLIALAVLGAPKILMDLFGHKQIAMTLHYILADPTIRAEMLEVARAQTIMLAKTAIQHVEECGGAAAEKLQSVVRIERFRMGNDFDEDSLQGLAETLTINGQHWQLVRPGVLCTKGPQVAGACTPSTAMPEPSRCRTHCDYRLELGFLRDDVNRLITFAVGELKAAFAENDNMKIAMWRGQILTNIDRFGDLKSEWSSNEMVRNLLAEREAKEIA